MYVMINYYGITREINVPLLIHEFGIKKNNFMIKVLKFFKISEMILKY